MCWAIVYHRRNEQYVRKFVAKMHQVCPNMGIELRDPAMIALDSDRTDAYVNAIRRNLPEQVGAAVDYCTYLFCFIFFLLGGFGVMVKCVTLTDLAFEFTLNT